MKQLQEIATPGFPGGDLNVINAKCTGRGCVELIESQALTVAEEAARIVGMDAAVVVQSDDMMADRRARLYQDTNTASMLQSLPPDIEEKFVRGLYDLNCHDTREVADYFVAHSDITRLIRQSPGSALAFEYLYLKRAPTPIDRYFINSIAGHQVYQRLQSLKDNVPFWVDRVLKSSLNGKILVDNVGSGPGRDMIGVLANNRELLDKVHVRNIDPDIESLKIGAKLAEELGIQSSFSFLNQKYSDVEPKSADLIMLIGILCPLKKGLSKRILRGLKAFSRPGGIVIYSTAQTRMLEDPVTDFIMRFTGWCMHYKTDAEAIQIGKAAGWNVIDTFYDEPLRHHQMTVAVNEKMSA